MNLKLYFHAAKSLDTPNFFYSIITLFKIGVESSNIQI